MIIDIDSNLRKVLDILTQKGKGCYGLIWYDNNAPRSINRLNGNDENGILYIGKADVILNRVYSLQKTILNNIDDNLIEAKIMGHQRLSKKFFRIRNRFKSDDLKIKIWNCPNDNPEKVESYLLEEYVRRFYELPPLNGQYGKYNLDEIILENPISLRVL